jgi:hypothetical protein
MGTSRCSDDRSRRTGVTMMNDSSEGAATATAHGVKASQSVGREGVSHGSLVSANASTSGIGISIAMFVPAEMLAVSHPNTVAASAVRPVKTTANSAQTATTPIRECRMLNTSGR